MHYTHPSQYALYISLTHYTHHSQYALYTSLTHYTHPSLTLSFSYTCSINDNESCAELLLERYSTELLNSCDEGGRSSVHAAAFNNHVECLQLLLRYSAVANLIDQTGKTPLMMATSYGHSAAVGKYHCHVLVM